MRFRMLDRITELVPGERIVAERKLTGREDYLADHFPLFKVMPGVLMLEAMYQAALWLIQSTDDFEYCVVRLKEARNVKYTDFVQPGQTLIVSAEIKKREGLVTILMAQGRSHGAAAVSAKLVLESVPLESLTPDLTGLDLWTRKKLRDKFAELTLGLPRRVPMSV